MQRGIIFKLRHFIGPRHEGELSNRNFFIDFDHKFLPLSRARTDKLHFFNDLPFDGLGRIKVETRERAEEIRIGMLSTTSPFTYIYLCPAYLMNSSRETIGK